QHTFTVGDFSDSASVWRDDCETTAAPNQRGTWQYPRAGWCPGAITHDRTLAAGAAPATATVVVSYDVEPYENTCRPEADECAGCSLGNGCDWNDSTHTEPSYQVSALLIGYE
ncbi:MAG: hypothetical protein H6699_12695, partial [Myxococcales bacterium]|nr:hypothetical protein [Myxococcales bacterium]